MGTHNYPAAIAGITNLQDDVDQLVDGIGPATIGRAITATLRVSPDGDGTDGLSWSRAFTSIPDALDAASTDVNDMTLILLAPNNGDTYYDIDMAGAPTWAANVRLQGTMRNFTEIRNTHASATSILKLTGSVVLSDISFNLHTGSNDGVILTNGASRVQRTLFNGKSLSGAGTALWFDGVAQADAKIDDVDFEGHVSHMTALLVDGFARCHFQEARFHECLAAIQIVGATSDDNFFKGIDIGDCALGIDIDAGNDQHFMNIAFKDNTRNVDDEVGDSEWEDIVGEMPVTIHPDNFTGDIISTHNDPNTWGGDTEIIAAGAIDNPFRVVAVQAEADASEKFRMRFSADSGSSHYDDIQIEGSANQVKREASVFSPATDFIFNKGTRISASAKSESGNNSVAVWVEVQEI